MAARSTKPAEVEPEEDFEEELVEAESDEDIEGTGDDLDDLELEEVEEDEDLEEEVEEAPQKRGRKAPAKKTAPKERKKPANAVDFGTAELLAHIEAETGKKYDGRQLRVLLRKMKAAGELPGEAADGKRYSFTGPEDEKVVAIVKRVKAGEVDDATKAALDKLKKDAEAKRAEKKAAKEKAEAEAAKAEESDEEDAEEEVEVEETKPAPKPRARKTAATRTRRAPARKKSTDVAEDDEADDEE